MNNERLAAVLHHAAHSWTGLPDRLADDERQFAAMIVEGTDGRAYTVAVCEVRPNVHRPVHAVPESPVPIATLTEGG